MTFDADVNYSAHEGCGDGNSESERYFNTILLSAKGKVNYEPSTAKERELVSWLQSYEELETESN